MALASDRDDPQYPYASSQSALAQPASSVTSAPSPFTRQRVRPWPHRASPQKEPDRPSRGLVDELRLVFFSSHDHPKGVI